MSNNSYIKTTTGISMIIQGKPYTVNNTHGNYQAILDAVKAKEWSSIPDLINLATTVKKYIETESIDPRLSVDLVAGVIKYEGEEVHNFIVEKILSTHRDGFPITSMLNFLVNMYDNPSKKAVDELMEFLEYGKMPITDDGYFIAYKRVNLNYTSCYDSKTYNGLNTIVRMNRRDVDDRSNVTCSAGLHICSFEYLQYYSGARVIVLKVNPKDVVSIPTDYNNTKARVCEYKVIGELTFEEAGLGSHSFGTSVLNTEEIEDDTDWELNDLDNAEEDAAPLAPTVGIEDTVPVSLTATNWFKHGYTVGYKDGKNKVNLSEIAEVTLEGAKTTLPNLHITQQNVDDVNSGYDQGYKDGRGHKTRKHPIFDITK